MSSAPLKVLFVSVRADIGGGPKHLHDLLVGLAETNVIPYIASPEESPYGELFTRLAHRRLVLPKRRLCLRALFALLRLARKEGIDLIHSHGRGAGYYAAFLALFGFRWLHTFHGVHGRGIKFRLDKLCALLPRMCVCVSPDERRRALELALALPGKSVLIENGVDVEGIARGMAPPAPSRLPRLGTLARLEHQKGVDILLRFIGRWKSEFGNLPFELHIAGEGEDGARLRAMAPEGVHWHGAVSDPIAFLSSLDIYVSCSRGEGLPLSVLEAMACSLPCLLSNVTGHRSLPSLSFSLNSFSDFKAKATALIESASLRREWGARGRRVVGERYGVERMVRETAKLYEKICLWS